MNVKIFFIIILFLMIGCFSAAENYVVLKPELYFEEKEDDLNYTFTELVDFDLDSSGNLYILDSLDCVIKKYDNKNKFIMKLGRKGRGPGEFSFPRAIQIINDRIIVTMLKSLILGLNGKHKETLPYFSLHLSKPKYITPYKLVARQLTRERFNFDLCYLNLKDKTMEYISSFDARYYLKLTSTGGWKMACTIREYKYDVDSKGNVIWAFSDKLDVFKYINGKSITIIQDRLKAKLLLKERRNALIKHSKDPSYTVKKVPNYYQLINHVNVDEKDNIWLNVTGANFSGFIKYSNDGKFLGRYKYKKLLEKESDPEGWMGVKIRYGYIYFRIADSLKGLVIYRAKIPK